MDSDSNSDLSLFKFLYILNVFLKIVYMFNILGLNLETKINRNENKVGMRLIYYLSYIIEVK